MNINIRWMIGHDFNEVLDIDRETYGDNGWSRRDLRGLLRETTVCGMVAEYSDTICGFIIYDLIPQSIVIINMGVAVDVQRCGIGTMLVDRLRNKLQHQKRKHLSVLVRETNLKAQLFFRSMHFRCDSIIRNAFDDGTDESAYRFNYSTAEIPATRLDSYWKGSQC